MMKDFEIASRMEDLIVLFADIPNDVLMRFVNRNDPAECTECDRDVILRALAAKPNSGREQLKTFLARSVPDSLRKKPYWQWGSSLRDSYEKNVSCDGQCVFNPPLPHEDPSDDGEYVENAKEVARRDRELLKKLQLADEPVIRREILDEAEFNTACSDAPSARAEAVLRDGVVRAKLAELERYVKEQMADLRRETMAYLESLREEMLGAETRELERPPDAGHGVDDIL